MVVGHGCPVEVGGVVVNPGDIIFGDYDGIVVIPPDRLADVDRRPQQGDKRELEPRDAPGRRYPPRCLRPVRRALVGDRKSDVVSKTTLTPTVRSPYSPITERVRSV